MDLETRVYIEDLLKNYFNHLGVLKCSVIVGPYHIGLQEYNQYWRDLSDLRRKVLQLCWGFLGPVTTGQYSLKMKCQRLMAGRIDIYYRAANQNEARQDFEELGDQVMGNELTGDPKERGYAILTLLGAKFMHRGPMRFEDLICPIISCEGQLPDALQAAALVKEIDGKPEREIIPGEEKVLGTYFFLQSDNGKMHLAPFMKLDEYDPQEAIFIGEVDFQGNELIFYPEGDRNEPIDYTDHLFKD